MSTIRNRVVPLAWVLAVLLALLAPGVAAAATPARTGWVDVAVATVWTSPTSPRPVDAKALTNPVDVPGWLAAMTPDQQEGLTDDNLTQTQALLGQRVVIVSARPGWYEVAVPGQPTPRNASGYPGWVPSDQVTTDPGFGAVAGRPFALVDHGTTATLYTDPTLRRRYLDVSVNTRLPVLAGLPSAVLVAVPGTGPKWLPRAAGHVYGSDRDIPAPTGADLVRTATAFLGRPYLWAGRSGFGVDCSGFTSTVYQVNGITIPRDSGPQATGAPKVDRADLQPGDLLFYARDHGRGSIHHVAMYVGGGMMIEAYDHLTPVRITAVRTDDEYWGAVRYLAP